MLAELNYTMRILSIISLFLFSISAYGQLSVSKINNNTLPKQIKYSGQITNCATWTDGIGIHYVLTTETEEYRSKDKENNEVKNKEIYAYHYTNKRGKFKLVWKIYDYNKNCEYDVLTEFYNQAFKVTDLDKNGIPEIWLMYENQCTSDVSPSTTKIIMYEGDKKYAIRGQNRVQVSDKNFVGGEFTIDDNFKTGNIVFKQFGIKLWEQNKTRKW